MDDLDRTGWLMDGKGAVRETIVRRIIVVVDNHPLVRRGLSELINTEPDLEVGAQCGTPHAALKAITASSPDLVITGLTFGGDVSKGLALVADSRARHPALPVLVLSMHDSARWAERAIRAGASGFLSKQEIDETLLVAIRTVLDDKQFLSTEAGEALENP